MDIESFVEHWADRMGGAEHANAVAYTLNLLTALGLPHPDPADAGADWNDYVFERAVRWPGLEGQAPRRIDLYKRGCFVLEHKQSYLPGARKGGESATRRPTSGTSWDVLSRKARQQAFSYVAMLPAEHPSPPFVILCDVGRSFEIWADFTGKGRGYTAFPDSNTHRFSHRDLVRSDIQDRLRAIWTDPLSLDPTRIAAVVTREIADELAEITLSLERRGVPPEDAAHFLMRCIFTIFAADVDLLDRPKLLQLLEDCVRSPVQFAPMFRELWRCMNSPEHADRFFSGFGHTIRYFNGDLFTDAEIYALGAPEISRLLLAAKRRWRYVEPAIFGSLLEHALAPVERRRLGAHYSPRLHVELVVDLTVMELLRGDWAKVQHEVEQACDEHDERGALRRVRDFHHRLCNTRVLDPACGTGNFLYVAMELMKRLEGEVLQTLADLGNQETLGLETVDPRQFMGIEVNPRAAAIADLMLRIGFLQQHYRIHTGHPAEPILQAHGNIRHQDALVTWEGAPAAIFGREDGEVRLIWPNARLTDWPEAEFIVGNPPFIGGKDLRGRLDPGYAETVWRLHPQMNTSADFVMYWWERAADILTQEGSRLRRFGFVTTNSITQVFQRRTTERWLNGARPLSLVYAVPDHPWTKASRDAAAVRIAVTVAEAGRRDGVLLTCTSEADLDTDQPRIELSATPGRINADLTVGVDVTTARALQANDGLCSPGVKLHGSGFIVSQAATAALGLGRRPGLERHLSPYRNGRDLTARSRDAWVLDFHGLSADDLRLNYPEAYQHLVEHVKEARDATGAPIGRDVNRRVTYRDNWWIFGEPRGDFRPALDGLPRYIATVETAKHRVFQFLDAAILPDNRLICVADDDPSTLAVLSSRIHTTWALASGATLEDRPCYTKSRCFDPFPLSRLR